MRCGLLEMKNAGAYTIVEDESTCVVFGIPKAAIAMDAASTVLPLGDMARHAYKRLVNS